MDSIKVDLHTHTNLSDGVYSPCELIELANKNGINALSITDHDSINAYEKAYECANDFNIELIPGVEISTDLEDKEIHLLGLFININSDELKKYLNFFREERFHRAKRIINKLNNLGISISIDDVLQFANNSAIGRPHIANTLIEKGYVKNYQEAFEKFLGDYSPAFERKIHVSVQSALKLINEAGGLSFVAHPGYMKENLLIKLIEYGIDGIEVIHPSHNENQIQFYRGIVNQYCLLETGGSDFHGGKKMDSENLGKYFISGTQLSAIKKMTQMKL
ncbi:PHP domain-containing protein [Stygiobacter electus]|jgi:predicted metal-dependent phosphoesterase TrpH|uniref:PHP domain-containing protein n=1 Tax=Stygiobacter electus TaxID=3032292 RepID=A0AAE3TCW2_9BACT|nr:PHP domain-containing protein [Stygiobacter electus]MDF1611866.1 PHP domain-containing protein [Stygiobacter electus]